MPEIKGRHPDIKSTAQQMRSFDVILQPANEAPAHLSKPAGTGTFIVLPQHLSVHPTAERTEHRKRATQISSGGRAHCTPPPLLRTGAGDFPSKHSLPFPDRGPSSLGLVRSSKAVRLLLWGHPSATTTTGWKSSFLKLPVGGHILDTYKGRHSCLWVPLKQPSGSNIVARCYSISIYNSRKVCLCPCIVEHFCFVLFPVCKLFSGRCDDSTFALVP